jgi:hypothetical protein
MKDTWTEMFPDSHGAPASAAIAGGIDFGLNKVHITKAGKEAQSSKTDERLLSVSTRTGIKTISEVGLLIHRLSAVL